MRWPCCAAVLLVLLAPTIAAAYSSVNATRSLFPERYVACNEPREVASTPAPSGEHVLLPVATRRRMPRYAVVPDAPDEVVFSDPIITGGASEAEPHHRITIVDPNDYRCIGLTRGKAGILQVLSAPPGTRFREHNNTTSWIRQNMIVAAAFDLREASPPIRATLARPISDRNAWNKHLLRAEAAHALAVLGDQSAAPVIARSLVEWEQGPLLGLWKSTALSLFVLAPHTAEDYAVDLLQRLGRDGFQYSKQHERLEVLAFLSPRKRRASLDALRRLTAQPEAYDRDADAPGYCQLMAARMTLGDPLIVDRARAQIATSLRDNWAVNCYSEWLASLFGARLDDVDTLLFRVAYDRILNWLVVYKQHEKRARRDGDHGKLAKIRAARQVLQAGLEKRSKDPRVSSPRHVDFSTDTRAKHFAALAALGDTNALRKLQAIIVDSEDRGDAPWLAARLAVELELPNAVEFALRRLRMGLTYTTEHRWIRSGRIGPLETRRVQLLEVLVRTLGRQDLRWSVALLDREQAMRESALMHVARVQASGVCDVVADAAQEADRKAVQDGFWALSMQGSSCRGSMEKLVLDSDQPAHVRGMALELLAMLRSPKVEQLAGMLDGVKDAKTYVRRARLIAVSKW